jgi:hypothetical protein
MLMTLVGMEDTSAARALVENDLLWLLDRDPNELGDTQRQIRKMVADWLETG